MGEMKLLRATGIIGGAVVFYVLSVGPVAMMLSLTHPRHGTVKIWVAMYYPLTWMSAEFPPFEELLKRYISLWLISN